MSCLNIAPEKITPNLDFFVGRNWPTSTYQDGTIVSPPNGEYRVANTNAAGDVSAPYIQTYTVFRYGGLTGQDSDHKVLNFAIRGYHGIPVGNTNEFDVFEFTSTYEDACDDLDSSETWNSLFGTGMLDLTVDDVLDTTSLSQLTLTQDGSEFSVDITNNNISPNGNMCFIFTPRQLTGVTTSNYSRLSIYGSETSVYKARMLVNYEDTWHSGLLNEVQEFRANRVVPTALAQYHNSDDVTLTKTNQAYLIKFSTGSSAVTKNTLHIAAENTQTSGTAPAVGLNVRRLQNSLCSQSSLDYSNTFGDGTFVEGDYLAANIVPGGVSGYSELEFALPAKGTETVLCYYISLFDDLPAGQTINIATDQGGHDLSHSVHGPFMTYE